MSSGPNTPFFESSVKFESSRIHAVAVYCSDGRFGEQVDELLQTHLGLPRYDRLAVPGGAACLAWHFETYREEESVIEQLRFLASVHKVQRVVLVAHEGCAFYTERLRVPAVQLEARQREDICKAISRVRDFGLGVEVLAFFARLSGATVRFERILG
jgi:hypothetical protein